MGTNQNITAAFSEPMDSASITASGTFTVTGPGVTPVAGTVTYDATNNIAVFTPTGGIFASSTTFTATITTAAQSAGLFCPWRATSFGPSPPAPAPTLRRQW